ALGAVDQPGHRMECAHPGAQELHGITAVGTAPREHSFPCRKYAPGIDPTLEAFRCECLDPFEYLLLRESEFHSALIRIAVLDFSNELPHDVGLEAASHQMLRGFTAADLRLILG